MFLSCGSRLYEIAWYVRRHETVSAAKSILTFILKTSPGKYIKNRVELFLLCNLIPRCYFTFGIPVKKYQVECNHQCCDVFGDSDTA
jgi:hypothetical protein